MLVTEIEKKTIKKVSKEYNHFINKTAETQKSEWIDGKLVLQSPARKRHLMLSKELTRLMSIHADRYELGYVAFEKALINLEEGVQNFEPDIVFFSKEKEKKMDDSTCMFEAPDFVVEILSKSTEKIDRGIKFQKYEKHGVKEYWIINAEKKTIELYYLKDKKYQLIDIYRINDYISSRVLEDFSIPVRALFNTYANLAELDRPLRNILTKQFKKVLDEKREERIKIVQEKDKKIEEKDKNIEEKDKKIEEKDKKIEEKDKKIEEKDKKIEEKESQLKASISLMKTAKLNIQQIIQATGQTKEFIENC